MAERRPAGARIRDRRIERGLRQAGLAGLVGVSPSYLNLIEHGRRRVAGKLLADIARALDLDPALLSDLPDAGRLGALRTAAAGAEGVRPAPEAAQDLLDRFPGWAALIAAQARRIESLEARAGELAQRLSHDHALARALHQVLSGVTAIRSAAGILTDSPDLDRDWQARFLANIRADSEELAEASRTLARALEGPQGPPPASPREEAEAWLEARGWHLPEIERGGIPDDLPESLGAWARRAVRDALALPLASVLQAAQEVAYDPVALARRLDAPLPRVLRRLAALPPGHPRFGLVLADASGTVTLLKPIEGFPAIRAGACPLWPLYEALAQPGRALRAHAALPGQGAPRFLCHAVAAPIEEPDWDEPPRLELAMLLAPAPPGALDGDRLVGPTCRLCPRQACPARREPSVLG
jgi:predicted transcriptional regulator/DNA-binding XRE family transcriptional regulator